MTPTHILALALAALVVVAAPGPAQAQGQDAARRVRPGDRLEAFTLPDVDGRDVYHDPARGRATVLVFLAAHQKRSERAFRELSEIVADLRAGGHEVDLLAVASGGEDLDSFRRLRAALVPAAEMPVDADDMLWGRLGVVVAPTTFVVDTDSTIRWIRAGHAYDFAREARAALHGALGLDAPFLAGATGAPSASSASTETDADRAYRHLRVGQILARRSRTAEAIDELRKAEAIAPESVPVGLALADLLSRTEEPREALAVLSRLHPATNAERAEWATRAARAHRLIGEVDRASSLVDEAVSLDPTLALAHYERGRLLESRGDCAAAMEAYRRALEIRFEENKQENQKNKDTHQSGQGKHRPPGRPRGG